MINLSAIDNLVMAASKGLDVFDATFHASAAADPVDCRVMLNTLELTNEYGVPAIQSGAEVHYLRSQISDPSIGSWFLFNDRKYVIENKVPSQDTSMRVAHCRVESIP